MRSPLLTLVAGPPGIGKTTWIRQQIAAAGQPAGYLNLGAGAVPLDGTYLAAELPNLFLWEEADLLDWEIDERSCPLFVELGFQIDPSTLSLPRVAACRRVAVLPPAATQTEWHDWAEEVVVGGMGVSLLAMVSSEAQVLDLWRSPLTGQVFDPASLIVQNPFRILEAGKRNGRSPHTHRPNLKSKTQNQKFGEHSCSGQF